VSDPLLLLSKPYPRQIARLAAAFLFLLTGILHFVLTDKFLLIVPPFLPWPLGLVYVSGFFELLGGLGLLFPRFQRLAGIGLIVLLIAVWPANIYMAIENIQVGGMMNQPILQWLRVPLQAVIIAWVHWCSKQTRADPL